MMRISGDRASQELQGSRAARLAGHAMVAIAPLHGGYMALALAMGLQHGPLPPESAIGVALSLALVALAVWLGTSVGRGRRFMAAIAMLAFVGFSQLLALALAIYTASAIYTAGARVWSCWLPIVFIGYIGLYAMWCIVTTVLTVRARFAQPDTQRGEGT